MLAGSRGMQLNALTPITYAFCVSTSALQVQSPAGSKGAELSILARFIHVCSVPLPCCPCRSSRWPGLGWAVQREYSHSWHSSLLACPPALQVQSLAGSKGAELSEEEVFRAQALGWCIEFLQVNGCCLINSALIGCAWVGAE